MANPENESKTIPGIRVKTSRPGFRRGGRAWADTTEVAVSEFTAEQLAQIRAEQLLVVEDIDLTGELIGGFLPAQEGDQLLSSVVIDTATKPGK